MAPLGGAIAVNGQKNGPLTRPSATLASAALLTALVGNVSGERPPQVPGTLRPASQGAREVHLLTPSLTLPRQGGGNEKLPRFIPTSIWTFGR